VLLVALDVAKLPSVDSKVRLKRILTYQFSEKITIDPTWCQFDVFAQFKQCLPDTAILPTANRAAGLFCKQGMARR